MGDKEKGKGKRPANSSVGEDSGPPPVEFDQTLLPAEEMEGTLIQHSPGSGEIERSTPPKPVPKPVDEDTAQTAVLARKADWPDISDVELEEEIGRGGMGVVYSGRQSYLDRRVAVKLLASTGQGQTFAARFQREAKILASLSHPHIVSCYQAGTLPDGKCFLVMEYIDGPNLLEWIKETGAMSVDRALSVCRDVALALQCAFEKTIIHRDVKPANVLLQRVDGADEDFPFRSKLADLGLARDTSDDSTNMALTVQGAVMGSPPTMAPEQFDDPDNVDYRADIYALGCTLYHMLTGCLAFPQKTITAALSSKLAGETPDPCNLNENLHPAVAQFVKRLLARHAAERPQTYEEVIRTCDELIEVVARRPAPGVKKKTSGLVWGAVGAVVLVAGAAGLYFGLGSADAPGGKPGTPPQRDTSVAALDPTQSGTRSATDVDPKTKPSTSGQSEPSQLGSTSELGEELPSSTDGGAASRAPVPEAVLQEGTETPGDSNASGAPEILDPTNVLDELPANGTQLTPKEPSTSNSGSQAESQVPEALGDPTQAPRGAEDTSGAPRGRVGDAGAGSAEVLPVATFLARLGPGEESRLFTGDPLEPLKDGWVVQEEDIELWSLMADVVFGNGREGTVDSTHLVPDGSWVLSGQFGFRPIKPEGIDIVVPGSLARLRVDLSDGTAIAFDLFDDDGLQACQLVRLFPAAEGWTADRESPVVQVGAITGTQLGELMRGGGRNRFVAFEFHWDGSGGVVTLERLDESLALATKYARDNAPIEGGARPIGIALHVEKAKAEFKDLRFVGAD